MRRFEALGLTAPAALALAGTLGCGGKAESALPAPPAAPPPYVAPVPASPPRQPARPLPTYPAPATPSPAAPVDRPASPDELAEAQVENILMAYCGACHGPLLTPQEALGGIWFINDLEELAERGYVVPLRSAESRIVQVMRDRSMPPPSSGWDQPTEADIEVVEQYIDASGFWPEVPPLSVPPAVDAGSAPLPADAGTDGG
jgi:mono/diheme cytochrome c family protein